MAYHTWQDAAAWLGEHYPAPDMVTLQSYVDQVEDRFHNDVRAALEVPISSTDSPETFRQAKAVCSMRTAALYAVKRNQDEGTEDKAWFPRWLEGKAADLVAQMISPHQAPDDRVAAESPVVYLPSDGRTTSEREAAAPRFKRAHLNSGTGSHW